MTEKTTNINTALLKAQKDMGPVRKDGKGNYGKYATLDGVIETIADTLNNNGILYMQPLVVINGEQHIKTMLVHADSGDQIESFYRVVCKDMEDPQKIGGAITYGRRYSLLSLLGLAPEDDDGTLASSPQRPVAATPSVKPTADTSTGEVADPDGITSYYNNYEKKMYHQEPCSVAGCGKTVRAKAVSFSNYRFKRTLCMTHQDAADSGQLDDEVPLQQTATDTYGADKEPLPW